jgi:hypothetical protein
MPIDPIALDREARERAIEPSRSCIVQAPAGSGKTSLLTLRFLRLLADVECPEQIVAITFTRKAAADAPPDPGSAQAGDRAASGWREAALTSSCTAMRVPRSLAAANAAGDSNNPARLHVQTIDGLNHWLARRLPLAARIGLSAALVDDARGLYAEAARRTVNLLDDETPVAGELDRLARALNHEPRVLAQLIEGMLGARELWLPKLLDSSDRDALRAEIDRLLKHALEGTACGRGDVVGHRLAAVLRNLPGGGGRRCTESPVHALAPLRDLPAPTAGGVPQWQALAELLLTSESKPAIRKQVAAKQVSCRQATARAGRRSSAT